MISRRISSHPILPPPPRSATTITWAGEPLAAYVGETIAAALTAAGVRVFGHHPRDGAPQGLFCGDGRCAQCLVLVDGAPEKACVARVRPGLAVAPADGLPALPPAGRLLPGRPPLRRAVEALVIGGGPAGLAAACELGAVGVQTLLVDDKPELGGKLLLQTHRFFGSLNAVHAGSRGFRIAARLEAELRRHRTVEVWTSTTAVALFCDRQVGLLRGDLGAYVLVEPRLLLVMAGARERGLVFRGNTLPGVLGAGALQALLHRDLVRPATRLLVVGGGNVGLIAAYHALQAGIEVAALVEAAPECGGYRVHRDKLARAGVPILTRHTIVSANGREGVESATIAAVDGAFRPQPGSERTYACDGVLVAVGLDPERELYDKAIAFGLPALVAGDAEAVAEASSAILGGRRRGREGARRLGREVAIPDDWGHLIDLLKSPPGPVHDRPPGASEGVVPIFHCRQEIPCDPCAHVCPEAAIAIDPADLRQLPEFLGAAIGRGCVGCEKCVAICPGQAITLVDYRKDPDHPFVTVPFELGGDALAVGSTVRVVDIDGEPVGGAEVVAIHAPKVHDRTVAVKLRAPRAVAQRLAGLAPLRESSHAPIWPLVVRLEDDAIVCRCERVAAATIRRLIGDGIHDLNELKVLSRAGLGACGARTCGPLLLRLLAEAGVAPEAVSLPERRPLTVEVPLGIFAGLGRGDGGDGG